MYIRILTVGSVKESFYKEAIAEFKKRLGRYTVLEVVEVKDEKTVEKASDAIDRKIKEIEGQRLLSRLSDNDFVVALAIEGRKLSSTEFAEKLANQFGFEDHIHHRRFHRSLRGSDKKGELFTELFGYDISASINEGHIV